MKFSRIQTVLDIQDPANPRDFLLGQRSDFSAPSYSIVREGDTVRISHMLGSVVVPWTMIRWGVEDISTTPTDELLRQAGLEDTGVESPRAKRKTK